MDLKLARAAFKAAGPRSVELNDKVEVSVVAIRTMNFAKGLELRSVIVMACDDDVTSAHCWIELKWSVGGDAENPSGALAVQRRRQRPAAASGKRE